jgi:hypothetical protein
MPGYQWITNNSSGRGSLTPGCRPIALSSFGPLAGGRRHDSVINELRGHLLAAPSGVPAMALGDLLPILPELSHFLERELPVLLAEADLFDSFLERVRPSQVWVANQWGSEGTLIRVAQTKGIPVTQVQHALLEPSYLFAPIYSDRFLAWGRFWRDSLPDLERAKAEIVCPPFEVAERPLGQAGEAVTFFTAPTERRPLWNGTAAQREALAVLQGLGAACPVMVRVHPADSILTWQQAWQRLTGAVGANVTFDKGGELQRVLPRTRTALMYLSTVLMNCLASEVPMVSLGWYPTLWRERLEKMSAVNFADSIVQASAALTNIGTAANPATLEAFLSSTSA